MIVTGLVGMTIALLAVHLRPRPVRRPPRRNTPRTSALRGRRRRRQRVEAGFAHAVEMLILAVRAGYLPVTAMGLIAARCDPPIDDSFHRVVDQVRQGRRFADALSSLTDDLGPLAVPLVDTLAAADRYGLPLGPTLDRLAADATAHRRRAAEARVRQLPVRLAAPMVLCTLPSYVLLAIAPLLIGAISSLLQ